MGQGLGHNGDGQKKSGNGRKGGNAPADPGKSGGKNPLNTNIWEKGELAFGMASFKWKEGEARDNPQLSSSFL